MLSYFHVLCCVVLSCGCLVVVLWLSCGCLVVVWRLLSCLILWLSCLVLRCGCLVLRFFLWLFCSCSCFGLWLSCLVDLRFNKWQDKTRQNSASTNIGRDSHPLKIVFQIAGERQDRGKTRRRQRHTKRQSSDLCGAKVPNAAWAIFASW